jgi:hypothetical protein
MSILDAIFRFVPYGRMNAVAPSPQSGELTELQINDRGQLRVTTDAATTLWSDSGVVVAEKVVKGTAGRVHQILGRNTGGSAVYVFIFNHAAAGGSRPANGLATELFLPIKVEAGEAFALELPRARAFSTGLYWGASSTDATFTYASGATLAIAVEYE